MSQMLSYFQFDNLVKGRVPFLFINLGVDTTKVYPHIYKMHLDHMLMQTPQGTLAEMTAEEVVAQIQAQERGKSDAIVILCQDGKRSGEVGDILEKAGYINVFVVDGGWQKVLASV